MLGAPVVLWRDGDDWRAALDRCPHRFARLSEGRVADDGCIECPYHGWTFDGATGACEAIPQGSTPTARARATALPTVARGGLIWVWTSALYDGAANAAPDVGALDALSLQAEVFDAGGASIADYSRELPMDATMLLENVMDPSHLPYTHHDTISKRANAGPIDLRLDRPATDEGFTLAKSFPDRADVSGFVRYDAPSLVLSETDRGPGGFRDWNVVYAVPVAPGRCRLFVRVVFEVAKLEGPQRFVFERILPNAPPWAIHLSNHKVLEDDNIFLHHAGAALRDDDALHPADWERRLYMPTAADAGVRAYRRWLDAYTASRGAVFSTHLAPGAPAPRTRAALVDRRASHTDQCASCSRARATAARVAIVAHAAAFGLLALAALATDGREVLVVAAAVAYGAHAGARALLPAFDDGALVPPRNLG